jgi:hypothetical protein
MACVFSGSMRPTKELIEETLMKLARILGNVQEAVAFSISASPDVHRTAATI